MGHIQEKQEQQEPRRTQYAIEQLTALGYDVTEVATQRLLTNTGKLGNKRPPAMLLTTSGGCRIPRAIFDW